MYLIHGKMSRRNCNYRVELDLMARTNPPCINGEKLDELYQKIHMVYQEEKNRAAQVGSAA
jgi:hypothetical protein